jgi:hypothetical protein
MFTFTYSNFRKSFVRSTAVLLAVAGTGYVAGALQNPLGARDPSAAFARSVHAAPSDVQDPLASTSTVATPAVDWSRIDGERIAHPRECDLAQGISTDCIFMD